MQYRVKCRLYSIRAINKNVKIRKLQDWKANCTVKGTDEKDTRLKHEKQRF